MRGILYSFIYKNGGLFLPANVSSQTRTDTTKHLPLQTHSQAHTVAHLHKENVSFNAFINSKYRANTDHHRQSVKPNRLTAHEKTHLTSQAPHTYTHFLIVNQPYALIINKHMHTLQRGRRRSPLQVRPSAVSLWARLRFR